MVQYDKDGATLFYIDATGTKISAGINDPARYGPMEDTRNAQLQANRENIIAAQTYNQAVDNLQISVDAGHSAPAPVKPLMKVVSDSTGLASFVPFVPPLKDLRPAPPVTAPNSGKIAVETVDKQAIMYSMILAMFRKMFPDV